MNAGRRHSWNGAHRAAGVALGMTLAFTAVAAPPAGQGSTKPANLRPNDAGRAADLVLRPSPDRSLVSTLDLRAPAEMTVGVGSTGELHALTADGVEFPSARGTHDEAALRRLEEQLPSLGTEGLVARPMSRAAQLATRFRREGLPVARLFESRSALVSLGLNQRGKPGIWLIQKLP